MPRMTVNLPENIFRGLLDLARRDYRSFRDEAAWLIADAVRRANESPADESPVQEDYDGPV